MDFILDARERGLIVFITDCGAGGFSSAAGKCSPSQAVKFSWTTPLSRNRLISWEIFLSESQERMVMAVEEKDLRNSGSWQTLSRRN
ncbi:MAG: AIR synthase-related protein [Akkermansia sp.]